MRTNVMVMLALAVLTAANVGCCCGRCRNWLNRGSLCGTSTVAPAAVGTPVALGTPFVQQPQFVQPQVAAPVMQPMVMPQANCQCAPQCIPQCVPQCVPQCIPMCQPCCDPCASMGLPCGPGTWSGGYGYMDNGCCEEAGAPISTYEGGTMVPSTQQPSLPQTYGPPTGSSLTDPGPARVNYPDSTKGN